MIAVFNHVSCGGGGGGSSSGSSNPPPPPPAQSLSLTTNPATNVTKNSATLNGTVNPDGVNTYVYFEYGKTITYGSITPYQNIGSGTSNLNVYANLTSLSTNTTYNFRLVVTQGGLTFNGANQTFTTAGLPTCTTNPANNISLTSATLNGQVNPNGFNTDVYFDYGISATPITYPISTIPQPIGFGTSNVTVTSALSDLSASTLYNFRIVGSNSNGTAYGNNLIFITGSPSGSPPTCTTDPASNVISDSAKLKGTVNPNGTLTTGYFDYGLTTSYTVTTTVQTIGNGITSVAVTDNISGLSSTTGYNFRVVGINGTGTTYGNNMTFTTAPPPPTCTTNPAQNITYNSAVLCGAVNPNGLPTIAYFEYGLTTTPYASMTTPRTSGNGTSDVAVSAALSSLNAQTLYNFRCSADNSSGTTYGNNVTFTTAPPPPTCTTNPATNITQVSATLNGTVNPNGITTTAYFNYGLTTSYTVTTTEQTIISGTGNVAVTADISGLSPNTVYNFRCVAINSRGTTYGTNRTFGYWSTTIFTPPERGVFNDTATANSDNDDVVLTLNWLQRYSTTVTPTERYSHSMAYDSVRRKTVIFGGGWTTTYNNETWEWDGTNWLQRYSTTVTPTERRYSAMAYDSLRQKTVLFGGNTGAANNETWEWDGTNWTQRNPATSPSARYGHAMAYDSVRQKTVLFGGSSGGNETWEWNGTDWLQRSLTTAPSARYYHTMAYDSIRNVTVLFGGNAGSDETWKWDGTNWTQLNPATSPSARYVHSMAYDSLRQKTVLFGGAVTVANDETWEWDGANWLQCLPVVTPSPRYYHSMAYDSDRNVTVLFGGSAGGDETWELGSLYISSGTYISEPITPTSISSWGILTFTYNAPISTTFTVDILKSSDNSVLVPDVQSGTNLSQTYHAEFSSITGIKLRANFDTTDTTVTPTLSDWGVGFEGP